MLVLSAGVALSGGDAGQLHDQERTTSMAAHGHPREHAHGHQQHGASPAAPPSTPPATPPPPAPGTSPSPSPSPVVTSVAPTPAPAAGFTFADEFAGAAGSPPSAANWSAQTGQGIWGTGEVEDMVDSTTNAYLNGTGQLVIALTSDGNGGYRSARLQSTFSQQYGTWEICAKITPTVGAWPAIWFMGNDGQWPRNGEADLMENYGPNVNGGKSQATVHSSGAGGVPSKDANYAADTAWHIYRMEQAEGHIEFFVDGVSVLTVDSDMFSTFSLWPFDDNGGMYCILNVAAGGTGTNEAVPAVGALPVLMEIDYVHCWQ